MRTLAHSSGAHVSEREPGIVAFQDHIGRANIQSTVHYMRVASKRRDECADRLPDWGTR